MLKFLWPAQVTCDSSTPKYTQEHYTALGYERHWSPAVFGMLCAGHTEVTLVLTSCALDPKIWLGHGLRFLVCNDNAALCPLAMHTGTVPQIPNPNPYRHGFAAALQPPDGIAYWSDC